MSGAVMVVVGVVLALSGVWSIRLAVTAAGGGAAWLLADTFGAGLAAGLLVALAGAVVGAKLFILLDRGGQRAAGARVHPRGRRLVRSPRGEVQAVAAAAWVALAVVGRWGQKRLNRSAPTTGTSNAPLSRTS